MSLQIAIIKFNWSTNHWRGITQEDVLNFNESYYEYVKNGGVPHELWNFYDFIDDPQNYYAYFDCKDLVPQFLKEQSGKRFDIIFGVSNDYIQGVGLCLIGVYVDAIISLKERDLSVLSKDQVEILKQIPKDKSIDKIHTHILAPKQKSLVLEVPVELGNIHVGNANFYTDVTKHNRLKELLKALENAKNQDGNADYKNKIEEIINLGHNSGLTTKTVKPDNSIRNLILYGPPGTGKTFCTKRYALNILDAIPRN